jgi:hypothetical protein
MTRWRRKVAGAAMDAPPPASAGTLRPASDRYHSSPGRGPGSGLVD